MLRVLRKLERTEGTEIVEAAVVLPLLFMFLLGIVWFGRAFSIYATITQAAEQGAATAARPACTTCVAFVDQWNTTSFPGNTTVESSVLAVMQASSLDPSQIVPYFPVPAFCLSPPRPPGDCSTTANQVTICRSVVLNPGGAVPQCGTIVSFQYPFKMNLPFTSLNMQAINLKVQAESRMQN